MHVTTNTLSSAQRNTSIRSDFTEYLENQGIATISPLRLSPHMRRWMLWKPQHPDAIVFIVDEEGKARTFGADAVEFSGYAVRDGGETWRDYTIYEVQGKEIPTIIAPAIDAIVIAATLEEQGISIEFIY